MPLSKEQTVSVEASIKESLRKKFQNYKPESKKHAFPPSIVRERQDGSLFVYSIIEYDI